MKALTTVCLILSLVAAVQGQTQAKDGEARFLKNTHQLIYEGQRSGEGYFSPDGRALVFQSEREPGNPFFQIYILDLETGDSHRVSPGVGKTTCAFFRPGTDQVLFASTHLDPEAKAKQKAEYDLRAAGKQHRYTWDYDEYMDIFVADRDGSNLHRLTTTMGYDAEASYSPDGSKIVFCSLRDAYPREKLSPELQKRLEMQPSYFGEIYIMNADGTGQTRLTRWPGYDGGPFFTPDGKRIVWRHFAENGALADIYTMRLDGSDVQRVTDFQTMSWAPYFHPSGKYLIFASSKLGFSNFELYIVDARGEHQPVRVTYTDGFDGLPVFSPDGKRLCWTSTRTGDKASQLFIADWDHEAALRALAAAPLRTAVGGTVAEKQDGLLASSHADVMERTDARGFSPEIRVPDLQAEAGYLASDKLEGRLTGSEGTRLASEYIAARLQEAGLRPLGDHGSYFQAFEFNAGMKIVPGQNQMEVMDASGKTTRLEMEKDFRPLAISSSGKTEGEIVFVGYGLSVPGKPGQGYDSYAGLDVKDKIVLALRFVPEEVEMARRQVLNRYAGLRYKALAAREHGAKAILFVSGPNSPKAGQLIPLSYDNSAASSGILAASISGEVAERLFEHAGKDLKSVQSDLDVENPHAQTGFPLPGVKVKLALAVERIKKTDRNVVALLPGNGESDEYVIVGAHYDHIGHGEIGSLAHKGEEHQIHNGADDNASGTAMVLELAAELAARRQAHPQEFRRGIVFALWSGEELGIVGSSNFVQHAPVPLEKVAGYINFDMVGRLKDNKLIVQGVGSSSAWKRLLEKRNVAAGFSLVLQDDPYQPTDIMAFYPKGVPVLSFFTGSHEDYNRPTDDADRLNYDGMVRIAKLAENIIRDLASQPHRPEYVKVERTRSETGDRETLRAYLGTVPDYVSEGSGVKLSGVRAGGPADKAGLKGGDVIVKFAGQKITNIYDYTYALDAVKIGQPVEVVVLRDGKEVTLTVTPEARE